MSKPNRTSRSTSGGSSRQRSRPTRTAGLFIQQRAGTEFEESIDAFLGDRFQLVGRLAGENGIQRFAVAEQSHRCFPFPLRRIEPLQLGGDLQSGSDRLKLGAVDNDN